MRLGTALIRAAAGVILPAALLFAVPGRAAVVERLPTSDRVVALTFDACETTTPSFFDEPALSVLREEKVPFTLFLSGAFARRNEARVRELAKDPLVGFGNHSLSHRQHMQRLSPAEVEREVRENEALLEGMTGRKPMIFRFPAGNYDQRVLRQVEGMGYRVVHWDFPSGDADPAVTPERLTAWVLEKARPGSILIFHLNGRGYSTAKALPGILRGLREKGYSFVALSH